MSSATPTNWVIYHHRYYHGSVGTGTPELKTRSLPMDFNFVLEGMPKIIRLSGCRYGMVSRATQKKDTSSSRGRNLVNLFRDGVAWEFFSGYRCGRGRSSSPPR